VLLVTVGQTSDDATGALVDKVVPELALRLCKPGEAALYVACATVDHNLCVCM
jgi:hypothetical protein